MKITFLQKQIGTNISNTEKAKLSKERSDFLLIPEFGIQGPDGNLTSKVDSYEKNIDHLLDVSEAYKGVILGGTLIRRDSRKKTVESVPLVQDVNLIDHYDVLHPGIAGTEAGESETIFIMAGVRFAILTGKDIEDKNHLAAIEEKGVQILFYLDGNPQTRTYDEDLEYFSDLSKSRNWNIFRICGFDRPSGREGRSLVSTPTGIQWKVGKTELDKEILKTIHFAIPNPFL